MGETSNLNWWSPDFWTINSSTLGKESSITLHKPWCYCFINFFNAWNPKQPTFFNGWKSWFPTISQVLKNCLFNHPNWNHLLKIPLCFPGCLPARCMYLWKKTSSHENGGNSAREAACDVGHEAGELRVFVLDIWPQDLGPSSRPKQTRSESSLPSSRSQVNASNQFVPLGCLFFWWSKKTSGSSSIPNFRMFFWERKWSNKKDFVLSNSQKTRNPKGFGRFGWLGLPSQRPSKLNNLNFFNDMVDVSEIR